MKTGKLMANKKMLESQNIPTDRFFKRMEVFIFREYNDKGQLYYYCGDCADAVSYTHLTLPTILLV